MSQTIYIQLGKCGDICALLPILWHDHQSRIASTIMVARKYAPLFDGISYVNPVIFDGDDHELDRAVAEAKQLSDDVRCCQVAGPTELVRQHTFTPARQEHAVMESFVKEAWKLAGKFDLWKQQPPLVFDRRDAFREKQLRESLIVKNRTRKPIFIALGGETSSFPHRELLVELVRMRHRNRWNIIDISDLRAERFYDLLGLYEKARCVIASDSAPLHLTQSCPQIPVVALINDKPSYWHGSAWRPNHVFHCRYADFPGRALEMLHVIDRLDWKGQWFYGTAKRPRILRVWNAHGSSPNPHLHTWAAEYENEQWIEVPAGRGMFGRDSKTVLKDEKRWPFVKDMIRAAALRVHDDDVIFLTAPDVGCNRGLAGRLLDCAAGCWSHRAMRDDAGDTFHPAVDLIAFTKLFWRQHHGELPDFIANTDRQWTRVMMEWLKAHGGVELPFAVFKEKNQPVGIRSVRHQHNEKLATDWLAARSVRGLQPAVSAQIPTVPLNRRGLNSCGYNGSLIRWQNRWLLAYRWHATGTLSTTLAVAELDDTFNVLRNQPVQAQGASTEDPRLFIHRGQLWLSYVDSIWPEMPPHCVMRYGQLVEDTGHWRIEGQWKPDYGRNDGTALEKNWVFFSHADRLFAIYQSQPEQIVLELDGHKVVAEHKSRSLRWAWGAIKGGTPPLPHDGGLLRFSHSTLDNELAPWRRRYYLGACLMDPVPPFAMRSFSSRPIVSGSEDCDLMPTERSACAHYKPQVVFPAGAVAVEGGWLVSVGINDSSCVLLRIKPDDLKL